MFFITSVLLICVTGCVTAPCVEEADDPDSMHVQQHCSLRWSVMSGREKWTESMNLFHSELQSQGWFHRKLQVYVCLLNFARICFLSSVAPVVHCPVLAPPENGFFIQNVCNNHFDAACGTRCLPDYDLQGTSIRLCQADGTWSGTPATCAGEEEERWDLYMSSKIKLELNNDRIFFFLFLFVVLWSLIGTFLIIKMIIWCSAETVSGNLSDSNTNLFYTSFSFLHLIHFGVMPNSAL